MTVEMMLVTVAQMTVKTALRIIHSQYNDASENTENENAGNENAGESLDTESMAVYDYMSAAGILSAGDAGIIRNGSTR